MMVRWRCCSSLQPCNLEATQHALTVGTMPQEPMWSTSTASHLLSKWPILETIFWVCLFICFFCPTCWEWWQGSFLVNVWTVHLKWPFQLRSSYSVWIFKQFSPKKKSGCIFWKVILLNLDLGAFGSLSLSSFHKKHDVVSVWKRK